MNDEDTLRPEYPVELIKSGVRGKYAKRYQEGTNIVVISPELHKLFPDSDSVNKDSQHALGIRPQYPE